MKYMHKAIWQADGNLVIRGNSRALLFRAIEELRNRTGEQAAADPQLVRTLQALDDMLGHYDGRLPSAAELLGNPINERVACNLLKG